MSCAQVAAEFSADKFRLVYEHPSVFGTWRYTCCPNTRGFYIYRVLFAALIIILLILDFFWIIGFAGAGDENRLNACLDASQLSLIVLAVAYFLLSCSAFQSIRLRLEPDSNHVISYKPAWLFYTCSVNAVYTCMIVFWIGGGSSSTLEQQLKNSIPGILILFDLCVSSVPLFLCHAIYVILFYLLYLAVAALGLFLSYTLGPADKQLLGPSNPTVWIGGYPLLVRGYRDFTDPHRIVTITFGTVALAIMVHGVLLSVVITRDFFASLFHHSTEMLTVSPTDTIRLYVRHSSSTSDPVALAPSASDSMDMTEKDK